MYYDIDTHEMENIVGKKMKGVFLYTSIALILTFLTSFLMITNKNIQSLGYALFPFAIGIQIIVPIIMAFRIYRAKKSTLAIGLLIYAIATGVTLSSIALIYTLNSIISVLLGTIVLFIVLAIYGYTTSSDLSKFGSLIFGGLIALIIVSIINLFLRSSSIDFFASVLGVIIFVIYVSFDVQNIKRNIMINSNQGDLDLLDRVEIVGAFSLYLDFINLFIYLIKIFGRRD